ncbi:uncharacterized protein N7443_002036 [Penicillium atrosanguineum]|uniref:uncharacterized protein n=1 Tax=Penicillium atrosanguineum TaxID=1132637 RepID=UPI00238A920D|nr:uncharacterized protein N7443_002036 [Penicillium atrosanguineum]KAJ5309575.1 hypothetical protein N7443_002036 [Penicillium atrosanguineum]
MSAPQITLYFDIGSPFSHIAFHVLKNSPVFSKCEIQYIPASMKDIFQLCQNAPPLAVKNKSPWLNRERLYWARRFDVPMSRSIPKGFPASTVHLQTALALVAQQAPEKLVPIAEKLYETFWANGDTTIITPEMFSPVFENELGGDVAKAILTESTEPKGKSLFDENTQKAFASGAFGLPWFECTNAEGEKEEHWGIDHLGRVADFLRLDTTVDPSFKVLL